jgi:NAD(P) transhydrogenase subunit beta
MDAKRYFVEFSYLFASVFFIIGLKSLSHPDTARRGMHLAEIGGAIAHFCPMTALPQQTALSHAFGAFAAALVGIAEYSRLGAGISNPTMIALGAEVILGGLTTTGSLVAAAKLQDLLPGAPMTFKGQNVFSLALLALSLGAFGWLLIHPGAAWAFYLMLTLAFIFGLMLVLPIAAADMPVVMSLLNSYAGLAATATGFAINNNVLIIAGTLNGFSGFILSVLMCRAMNRSITNVIFGAFGSVQQGGAATASGEAREINVEDVATQLAYARQVVFVPGYGMATAQAQHVVRELADVLEERGVNVKFAIHPVAGRMPGHMNVLLAEADVPYSQLYELEQINPEFQNTDVAVVIGANDVVNPDARDNPQSPIAGMPILDVDRARSVVVLKRGKGKGFAGIENPLFFKENTGMLYGDAKSTLTRLVQAVEQA